MTSSSETGRRGAPPWLMPALIGGLLVLAALVALVLTTRSAAPIAQAPAQAAATAQAPASAAEDLPATHGGLDPAGPPVTQISLADARTRFDAGTAIFIDVRAGSDYAAGHIPGALTITSRELEERMKAPPAGTVIIAYGDATRPESGQRGAQIFMDLGYPEVIALEGGFQAWRDAGHPVEGD